MRKNILIVLICCFSLSSFAENRINYTSLDKADPISFGGDHIIYRGKKIPLNDKAFFIDGRLSDSEVSGFPYVFNSINKAFEHVTDGTGEEPMTLYLAPYVYWVDDPDDPAVRKPAEGAIPYGKVVKCNWLQFYGLTDDARNVVLASSRGQMQGAVGNFTMFYFDGDGIRSENITFGNYCNVDLEFPLLPELNRARRSSTITQAQLIICKSDKVIARNTNFISRLNLCPFAGAKRILFDTCYFECTDDALCSTGLYLNCRFTFFSSKPFYSTQGTGAVFLNCDFDVLTTGKQYLTKAGSPVTIVDSRFRHSSLPLFIGWTQDPTDDLRCYQYNVSLNGTPLVISENKPEITVDMKDKPVLEAYRLEHNGKIIYNTYNLLRGHDDWDPMGVKMAIRQIEEQTARKLTDIPTYIKILPPSSAVESGVTSAKLMTVVKRFGNYEYEGEPVTWSISPEYDHLVSLDPSVRDCVVHGIHDKDETLPIIIGAKTPLGLESASRIIVSPKFLDAPSFAALPKIVKEEKGKLKVDYKLDLEGRNDESLITWYRCTDARGNHPVEVMVSRLNSPEYSYELSNADTGYYIMASVAPKHIRCHPGEPVTAITAAPVNSGDFVPKQRYYTDFQNLSVKRQPEVIPGFWTVDGYKPAGLEEYDWDAPAGETWYYGTGVDGMQGNGLVQTTKGARLLYTPVEGNYTDMSVTLNVDPGKKAGQGFGSPTGQYLDVYIKFDTKTLTGYGLRITRTTKYDNAVDFILMRYEKGIAFPISEAVSSVCYRTDCTIELNAEGNKLIAHVDTKTELSDPLPPGLEKKVEIQAGIAPNPYGGIGIQHTGSAGANATMLHRLEINWKQMK